MSGIKKSKKSAEEIELNEFLQQVKKGNMPLEDMVIRLFDLVVPLYQKARQLDELIAQLAQLAEVNQKISDIHTLHFSGRNLPQKFSRRDRFMAQILLTPARKM